MSNKFIDPAWPALLPFTKMEGLGNDYIYVEEFAQPLQNPGPLAEEVSNRHFGIGGDGLVLMGPSEKADFRMRMFNADGSEGEMCGNAIRCVAKYLYEHSFTDKKEFTIETLAGIRTVTLTLRDLVCVSHVRVDMGRPVILPQDIPLRAAGDSFVNQALNVAGKAWWGTGVSMGNPHLVVPIDQDNAPLGLDGLELDKIGPLFEHHELFPKRVNTEFIEVIGHDRVRMRVWERGSGETLACGTGACAVLVACVLNGWTSRKAIIELRGGELSVEWGEDGMVYMTGPARTVFSGKYAIKDR